MKDRFIFRCWDEEAESYIYSNVEEDDRGINFVDGELKAFYVEMKVFDPYEPPEPHITIIDLPIEQCTGKPDIDENLIFESDKLKNIEGDIYEVYWDIVELAWWCKMENGFGMPLCNITAPQIIGNIHDKESE